MSGDLGITTKISAASFQQCDGSNFSTAGLDVSKKFGNVSLGGYAGVGTSFESGTTGGIVDFKGSVPYGNSCVSGGFRIRNNITPNSQTVQFRVQPATITIPVGKNTNIYTTPYVATKVNYKSGDTSTSVGNFTGVSTKVGNASVFVEGQIYDVTKINKNTTSVNVGVSIPI